MEGMETFALALVVCENVAVDTVQGEGYEHKIVV
jgi:hypothetical protein